MQPNDLREAYEWLGRAERDVMAAERARAGTPILGDAMAFHAQQAAEKALKGFLVAHGRTFARTHDLIELTAACQTIDPRFARFLVAAQTLTPYVVRFRYPGGPLEPSADEADQALQMAREIVDFVREQLPGLPGGETP